MCLQVLPKRPQVSWGRETLSEMWVAEGMSKWMKA